MPEGNGATLDEVRTSFNAFRQSITGSYLSLSAGDETRTCESADDVIAAFSSSGSGSWDYGGELEPAATTLKSVKVVVAFAHVPAMFSPSGLASATTIGAGTL